MSADIHLFALKPSDTERQCAAAAAFVNPTPGTYRRTGGSVYWTCDINAVTSTDESCRRSEPLKPAVILKNGVEISERLLFNLL